MKLIRNLLSAVLSLSMVFTMIPVTAMAETADTSASSSYTVWLSSSAETADPESEFTVDVNISADGHTAPPSAAQIKLSVKDTEYVASKSDVTNGKATYKDGAAVISYYSNADQADNVFDSEGRFTVAQYTFKTGAAGTSSEISVTDASGAASGSTLDASFLISENNGKVTVKSVGYVPELITEINSADDLMNFAKSVNAGISYEGKTVDLNADIQLEGEWTPIGTPDHPFTGEFDGKGNKVQGLVINADKVPYETTEEGHGKTCGYGFFGNIKDAAIRNVDVSGDIKYTAENDSNYVFFAFGGIVGCSDGSATIANCVNRVNIFSECARYTMVGGIAGWLGNNAANKEIKISDCMNYGQIKMHLDNKESTAYQSFAGGIAGLIGNAIPSSGGVSWQQPIRSTDITVERCGNYGSLTKESTKLHGAGNSDNGEGYVDYEVLHGYTGGILGMTSSCGEVVINECTNKGEIYGWHKFVGGIMGGIYRGTVQNCYNTGNMTTTADNKQPGQRWEATIAGIIGVTYEKVDYDPVAGPSGTGPFGSFSIINDYNGGAIDGTKLATGYGQTYPLYGKLVNPSSVRWTCSPEAPEKEENCYSYDDVAANKVNAEVMGSAFKADADNVQAGLPLLNWEESSVSNETYNVTFDVKNAAGEAVQGATVRVYTKSDMSDDSEVKAEGGVLALRSGTYYYKASADGYLDTKSSFKVDGKETVVTVTMQTEAQVTFNVKPASATFTLTDSAKAEVTPVSAGDGVYKYSLAAGAYYSYTASASGYNGTTREFTAAAGTYDVELTKSSYNPGDSDKMVYGSKNAGKTHTVTAGGTYYIGSGAEGTLTVNTTDAVTLVGKGVSESDVYNNLSINCVQAGTKLTIQDVYMKYELTDTNMILFSGSDNYLNFKGTNILDKDTGASGYAMIYVPKGTDLTVSGGSGDYLYMYKRDQGAGIGGNGNAKGPEGQAPQYNGDITIDGGNYFMKNSKQGALIGAGAGAGTVIGSPGSIEINDASMYLIAESRAAAIGGSAGDKASAGSEITVNDSLITVNVDWSGSAIGGGGFDGGNDVDGGKLIYESGSIRTFIDRNAAGSWNVSGPCVNDVAITADKVNAKSNAVYMCAVDTSKLKSSKSYVTVKSDGTSVYSGGIHEWEFVDAYNAKNTTTVNYTIDNWVRCDDTCVYVYLTGEDHTLDVNGETVSAKWDASGKTFTLTYSDGSTSNGGSGGGSLTDDKTPLVSEVIKPDTKVSGSNASASVKKDDVDGAVKAVGDSSNAEIVIDSVSSKSGITHIEVSVPMESVKTIQNDTKADIVLKTDLGNITVDNRDLSAITAGTGSDVTFTIDKNSDGSMKLGITSGGKNIAAGKYILKYKYKIDGAVMKALAGKTGVDNSDLAGVLLGAKGADGKVTQTIIRDSFVTADGYLILNAPAGGTVTVAANGRSFSDVAASAWYAKAVGFAVSHELFNGVSDNEFAPSKSMTRGMFVTVLNRLAGEEDFSGKTEFTDVPADAWYATGTAWAASKGIVNGYGDGKFGPNDPVTREQMAVIMYNFTKAMGYDIKGNAALTKFSDSASVHSWAAEAMQWAVGTGVMSGNSDGTLDPRGTATRAQVATIMSNYIQVLLGVK